MGGNDAWERIQIKTFTKWCNNNLKKDFPNDKVENILEDWENGILLMKLAASIYKTNEKNPEMAVSMPKLKPMELKAASRIAKAQNCNRAVDMFKKAGVPKLGASAENLMDHEKVPILGMVWIIILDYAARGFGGAASEVKRALLEWVNKKTDGYERVNPPGVKNFTRDWRSGLAWCALIHAHRPKMIDYEKCLTQSNAENLETAFSIAEEKLDIPRLLDVEDVDTDGPDDKSIMTYVMEYFHRFASEGMRDAAAKQAAEWLGLLRSIFDMENDYERRAKLLAAFIDENKSGFNGADLENCAAAADAQQAFDALREFVVTTKPPQEAEKMDLEKLFLQIQTVRKVNNLRPYAPPAELTSEALEDAFNEMVQCQNAHAKKVREAGTRFVEKKEDLVGEEIEKQIEESFNRYDSNSNGEMNKTEFEAACMEMNVVSKTQEEKDNLFNSVAKGDDTITKEEYRIWMMSRLVHNLDDPEGIKSAFKAMARDADVLDEDDIGPPLSDAEIECLKQYCPKTEDGKYDYKAFVDSSMGGN